MAKKKKSKGKRRGAQPTPDDMLGSESLGWMLGEFARILDLDETADTPLERALDLASEVAQATDEQKVQLARKVLEINPDASDAYLILARQAESLEDALALIDKAVAAADRSLRTVATETDDGAIIALVVKSCAHAHAERGECLSALERLDEAAAAFATALKFDPDDEDDVRYSLATLLLQLDRDDEVRHLLGQYKKDKSATWAYTQALAAFRQGGASAEALKLLKKAAKANRYVPAYLLGDKMIPEEAPEFTAPGRDSEAAEYADYNRRVWLNTPGAISWLRESLGVGLPTARAPRSLAWPQRKLKLLRLPTEPDEVWQFDAIPVPAPGHEDSPPWALVIVDHDHRQTVGMNVFQTEPRPKELLDYLLEVMAAPTGGSPRRPAKVMVRSEKLNSACAAKLKQIGVECVLAESLPSILDSIGEHLGELRKSLEGESPDAAVTVEDLRSLPLEPGEVWQADVRPFPGWADGPRKPYRPLLGIVISRTSSMVLAHELSEHGEPSQLLWQAIVHAMQRSEGAPPRRPGLVEVWSIEQRDALLPRLEPLGIECNVVERLDFLDLAMEDMTKHLEGVNRQPTLLDAPGVQPATLAPFYAAAAGFYRDMPWRRVPGDTPIEIRCDRWQSGPRYAVVMGQSGVQQGLAIYEDLAFLRAIIGGQQTQEEHVRGVSALSLMYGEAFEIPVRELDALERRHWPIAGPEAYPLLLRITPGGATRAPLVWEIEQMTACLRAVPEFLGQKQSPWSKPVAVASGEMTLSLEWLDGAPRARRGG